MNKTKLELSDEAIDILLDLLERELMDTKNYLGHIRPIDEYHDIASGCLKRRIETIEEVIDQLDTMLRGSIEESLYGLLANI